MTHSTHSRTRLSFSPAFFVLALLAAASMAATDPATPPAKKGPKRPITVRGEILDMSCYLSRGLAGPLHRDCARQCIASGVPMGIMGEDSTIYLLAPEHGRAMAPTTYTTPNPYVQLRDWATLKVEVMGMSSIRGGVHILEVSQAKLAPAAPAAAPVPAKP